MISVMDTLKLQQLLTEYYKVIRFSQEKDKDLITEQFKLLFHHVIQMGMMFKLKSISMRTMVIVVS
jgi:hypothetical protein